MDTVLFTQSNSVYRALGCDCWDVERGAQFYSGSDPVIAHPPCRSWSRLKHLAKPVLGEKELAIWALEYVREYGGVLEHPSGTSLFKPFKGYDSFGGFILPIDQYWFGHPAQKKTWLYIVGIEGKNIPLLDFKLGKASSKVELQSGHAREKTPVNLAIWLLLLLRRIKSEM